MTENKNVFINIRARSSVHERRTEKKGCGNFPGKKNNVQLEEQKKSLWETNLSWDLKDGRISVCGIQSDHSRPGD